MALSRSGRSRVLRLSKFWTRVPTAAGDADEPHATLHQPARQEATLGERLLVEEARDTRATPG